MADDREAKVVLVANTDDYNRKLDEAAKSTTRFASTLEKMSKTSESIVKTTSKGLFKVGTAELAGLTAMSAVAGRLEKQTSNIQSNMAINKTSSVFDDVTKSIRDMSRVIPISRAEIAAMTEDMSNLGFTSVRQIKSATEQFSKMGIATGESPQALASGMVQFARSMGMAPSSESMEPYSNAATYLSAKAGVSASGVLGFASNIAPAARVAGLDMPSVLGISALAQRTSTEGAYASSTISAILNDITQMRYTQHPEMRRYSTALGIPLSELQGEVAPEDTDKFNRMIISKILEVSQTEEGPSRLSLLGFEGMRAQRALQGLAAEPGGVEQWIAAAEQGMRTGPGGALETGFAAASTGMYDEMTKLRNAATDVGQGIGEPVMNSVTMFISALNAASEKLQGIAQPTEKVIGKLGGLVATVTLFGGAVLAAWKTISTMTMLHRGVSNVGTSAFFTGMRVAQAKVAGEDTSVPLNRMDAAVREGRTSSLQRLAYQAGAGVGSAAPNFGVQSPWQKLLMTADRARYFIEESTADWYNKAAMKDTTARYEERMRQQEIMKEIRPPTAGLIMNRTELAQAQRNLEELRKTRPQEIRDWEQKNRFNERAVRLGYDPIYPDLGERPTALPERVPLYQPRDRYSLSGVAGQVGMAYVRTPLRAVRSLPGQLRHVAPALGSVVSTAASDLWTGFRNPRVDPDTGETRLDSRMRRVGGVLGSVLDPRMLGAMAIMGGTAQLYRGYEAKQAEAARWEQGGEGFGAEMFSNLNAYNEKLGIATESLSQFSSALDDATNPAKTEDVFAELANDQNTFFAAQSADYEMYNERIDSFTMSLDSAKQYLSQFSDLNADQTVAIFRDLATQFDFGEWDELRTWFSNRQESDEDLSISFNELAASLVQTNAEDRSFMQKVFGTSSVTTWLDNKFGVLGLSNEQTQQAASDFVATVSSYSKNIAERRETDQFQSGTELEQQEALKQIIEYGKGAEALDAMREVWAGKGAEDQAGRTVARNAWEEVRDRLGGQLKIDLSDLNVANADRDAVLERMYEELTRKADEGDTYAKMIIESGIVDTNFESFNGRTLDEFINGLSEKTVTTTIDQMIAGSWFKDISPETREEYFGEGTVLSQMSVGITDPMTSLAASMRLLEFAQEQFGDSISDTEYALKSFTATLSNADVNNNVVQGAQALLDLFEGQFARAGGGPDYWTTKFVEDSQNAQKLAEMENPPADLQENILGLYQKGSAKIIEFFLKTREFDKQRGRANEDFTQQREWSREDFERQQKYSEKDYYRAKAQNQAAFERGQLRQDESFQRQLARSKEAFERGQLRQQEAFQRSMDRSKASFNRSQMRQEEAFQRSMARSKASFERGQRRQQEGFDRQMARSKASFYRNQAHQEENFQRQLGYQREDFNRARQREEESHIRQMGRMAQDMARSIADPFNRMRLQLLSDPDALITNMRNRAQIANTMDQDIDTLRQRGLSEAAMQQLNMFDFNNSQQTHHLARTMSDADIARFNEIAAQMVNVGGALAREQTNTKRAEEDRSIALAQQMEDFLRQLERTKIEHAISVNWSESEFKISLKDSTEEFLISIRAAREEFEISRAEALKEFLISIRAAREEFTISRRESTEEFLISIGAAREEFNISRRESIKEFKIAVAAAREEFAISTDIAEKNYTRAMKRANEAFLRAEDRSMTMFKKAMKRQAEDLLDYFDTYATTQEEMVAEIKRVLGTITARGTKSIETMIDSADKELRALRRLLKKMIDDVEEWTSGKKKKVDPRTERHLTDASGAHSLRGYDSSKSPTKKQSGRPSPSPGPSPTPMGGSDGGSREKGLPGVMQYLNDMVMDYLVPLYYKAMGVDPDVFGDAHVDLSEIGKGKWLSKALGYSIDPPSNGWKMRTHPTKGTRSFHYGVDVGRPMGAPLYAPFDGVAMYIPDERGPNGNYMVIKGDDHGLAVSYSHLSGAYVTGRVEEGERVARVGSTGYSTGPHLHIEVLKPPYKIDSSAINPYPFLAKGGIVTKETMAHVGEGGSPEAVIPLDMNGTRFMATFASNVANQLVRTMPRTAASNTSSCSHYDHSTTMNLEQVTVETSDPKRFISELKAEAAKKRAALYKSEYSGVQ